jgi:hypothetical protein
MPVVFRHQGIRFYFFSNECSPREPIHSHAGRGDAEAKLWLVLDIREVESFGFTRREQADLVRIVEPRQDEIVRAWHEHFGEDRPV